jgi:hypothetical protein
MKIKKVIKKPEAVPKTIKKTFNKGILDCEKPKKKRISVQAAKSKGRNLQKLVAKKISELLNEPFGPDEDIASRPMGQSGCDIRLSPRIRKLFPYSVECKCQEKFNVVSAIQQAIDNQQENTDWILVYTKNRFPTVITITLDHFFELLQRIQNAKTINPKKLSNTRKP